MINIDNEIDSLIKRLGEDYHILQYVYNKNKFIKGETPIYYSGMYWDNREISAAVETLLSGKWFSAGEKVKEFEKVFSRKIHQLFGIMVNSGSSANLIMIASLKKYYGWEDNDEIIVSVVGFPTTVSVIPQNNLKAIFVDIENTTLNFDISEIERKITDKTKAIFLSPVLGNPPDIDDLLYICEKYNLKLILDCCDSLGSKWNGEYLCRYAVASSHSFYPAHIISTGEGGMITTDIREVANIARSMSLWGRGCVCSGVENLLPNGICNHRFDKWIPEYDGIVDHKYVFDYMGYNLKPLDLQGAIGIIQVDKMNDIFTRRKKSWEIISNIFTNAIKECDTISNLPLADTVWFGVGIICPSREFKQKLVKYLEDNKIQTRNYFAGNILMHGGYSHLGDYREFPNANIIYDRVFFIGASPHYDQNVFEYIRETIEGFKYYD